MAALTDILAQQLAQAFAAAQKAAQQTQTQTAQAYTPRGSNTDEEILNKSPESWNLIQKAKDEYTKAQAAGDAAGMQRAHEAAESVRAQFGYSGGKDGSEYTALGLQNQTQALYDAALQELRRAQQAQQQSLQSEIDRAVARLDAQIPEIERSAADANTSAFETWLRATNPFGAAAQRQAQLGLGESGYSESSLANLGSAYQSAVGSNEQARQQSLRQLQQARDEALLTGSIEKANQMAEFARELAQQRFAQGQSLIEAAAQENEQKLARQKLENEMSSDERSQLETIAALLARYGIFDGYRALGVSDEHIAAMEAYWRALQLK